MINEINPNDSYYEALIIPIPLQTVEHGLKSSQRPMSIVSEHPDRYGFGVLKRNRELESSLHVALHTVQLDQGE